MTDAAMSLFNPDNFSSGGFFDDCDAVITAARVGSRSILPFTPDEDACYIGITFKPDDPDQQEGEQFYKVGSLEKFTPSTDGGRIVGQPGATANGKVKAAEFMASLVNSGFPKKELPTDNSVGFLVGLHVHLNSIQREFKGEKRAGDDGKYAVTLVTKFYGRKDGVSQTATSKPGPAKPRAVQPKAPQPVAQAAPAQTTAAPVDAGDVESTVQMAVLGLLAAHNGTINKRSLPTELMKAITDPAVRPQAFKLVGNNDWLGKDGQLWAYDAGSQDLTSL